jgi:transcriptional regulator with XRE-family HTH domain
MEHGRRRRSAIHTPEYQHLLKRLRQARLDAGLTQVQVAKALGQTQSYVTKCELGERRLDPIDLQRFAKVYGKPVTYFLPGRGAR